VLQVLVPLRCTAGFPLLSGSLSSVNLFSAFTEAEWSNFKNHLYQLNKATKEQYAKALSLSRSWSIKM